MEQILLLVLLVVVGAISMAMKNYFNIKKPKKINPKDDPEMNEKLQEMYDLSAIIREGAKTFMKTEYKIITVVVISLAFIFSLFIEKFSGLTFLLGACMSSAACILGMIGAVHANFRVARRAYRCKKVGRTVRTARSASRYNKVCPAGPPPGLWIRPAVGTGSG